MLDVVFGKKSNPVAVDELVQCLSKMEAEGTLYIGYPMFESGNEAVLTDAMLISREHGVVIFDLKNFNESDIETILNYQDELYRGVFQKFLSQKELLNRRELAFKINVISIRSNDESDDSFSTIDSLIDKISTFNEISLPIFKQINATIQKTDVLKPAKKRSNVTREDSYGGVMKKIEKEIANLDAWQKKAAIESPDKPQRIRGLAGSGKTIILAMKAAYLHAFEENKRIVVTFHSRTLYQQFKRLIEKFYFDHKKDEPDYSFLTIQHSWGGVEQGVYSEICKHIGYASMSWSAAETKYGRDDAFKGICKELLDFIGDKKLEPIYDYVLIDEAQDFPEEFFKLIYMLTKEPTRVVWAYDELQNLGEYKMLPPEKLFGTDQNSIPLVTLQNAKDKPQQDVLLPICYRNPPWTLTLALSFGLGIYRQDGLVKMFREPSFWNNIGFETVGGSLSLGSGVTLQRARDRTPDFFYDLIDPDNAIIVNKYNSNEEQAKWVANQIKENLESQELDSSDILVIYPVPYTMPKQSAHLIYELRKLNINCHIVGKDTSRDVIFKENSIAITHIHRAKGNEAAMVYVMNSQFYQGGFELGKKRNSLFTAITRTKAWLRVCGVGEGMDVLINEYNKVLENNFRLSFEYPQADKMDAMDNTYGDKSEEQRNELASGFEQIKRIKIMLNSGELTLDDVPEDIRSFFGE
ncbi:superfamily I DNA and RNA helicase [Pantoea sp. PNA 14-12]|uniref:DEAD/DEAH box helicase n=1 Tax=Pantoea TaxID=53335 RepID=UPI00105BD10D|nr:MULTISPECIES: ATP-binding domain-containing protein [Pantoea]TDS68369.1 superfamily I DNA and RNA helicase [Pantoea sp. PNA 14-12]